MDTIQQILLNLQVLGFSNVSVTNIYGKIANAVGGVIDTIIAEINNALSIITNLLISQQGYGKAAYYTGTALAFQYGDNLVINQNINPVTGEPYLNLYYPTIDTTKQIIAQAAIQATPQGGSIVLFLKVATQAVSGGLAQLSAPQMAAFSSYMLNYEILDSPLNIVSLPGNVLNFTSTATYLASYDLPTLQANLTTALTTFQTTYQLNGTFFDGNLEQYIQANVPGMYNFFITGTTLDGTPFSDSTNLSSGYFLYDSNVFLNISFVARAV